MIGGKLFVGVVVEVSLGVAVIEVLLTTGFFSIKRGKKSEAGDIHDPPYSPWLFVRASRVFSVKPSPHSRNTTSCPAITPGTPSSPYSGSLPLYSNLKAVKRNVDCSFGLADSRELLCAERLCIAFGLEGKEFFISLFYQYFKDFCF